MRTPNGYQRPAVAGSGAIAAGLAALATKLGEVRLLARTESSARRVEERVGELCAKLEGVEPANLRVGTDPAELADCDLVIEAIVEDHDAKASLHGELADRCPDADLATTTSSLGVAALGAEVGAPERFYGLHVFNPVTRMDLVELCLPDALDKEVRNRAQGLCAGLGKTAIEVPDQSGFVVNRLLFPYLFDAVRMLERTGLSAPEVDSCMTMGAGHPMGPLRLIDLVGIDVALSIGESLHAESGDPAHERPALLAEMAAAGKLGRKSGAGFYSYEG